MFPFEIVQVPDTVTDPSGFSTVLPRNVMPDSNAELGGTKTLTRPSPSSVPDLTKGSVMLKTLVACWPMAAIRHVLKLCGIDIFATRVIRRTETHMKLDQWIQIVVVATLVEMMMTTGLGVTLAQLANVVTNWKLVGAAAVANYVYVPLAAVGLLWLAQPSPPVVAGFLILAVCPGSPYGPPFTQFARGNVAAAVGVMVLLAGSSALIAPLLLSFLLPLLTGNQPLHVNSLEMVITLLVTQFLPLCLGMGIRHRWPKLAGRLEIPAQNISKVMNLFSTGLILFAQFPTLLAIRPIAFAGMLVLLLISFAAGWLAGGSAGDYRKSMTLVTSLRNVAVSLVIAASAFPGTSAMSAVVAYALVEITGALVLAIWWGRRPSQAFQG